MGVLCFKGSHVWENVIKYLGWKLSTAMLYIIHQVRLLTALQINLLKNRTMKTYIYIGFMALLCLGLTIMSALYGLTMAAGAFGAGCLILSCYAIMDYKEFKK